MDELGTMLSTALNTHDWVLCLVHRHQIRRFKSGFPDTWLAASAAPVDCMPKQCEPDLREAIAVLGSEEYRCSICCIVAPPGNPDGTLLPTLLGIHQRGKAQHTI